ncbi:MAG: phosphoribosyltransferase [Candidatus Freyarchaeota archaeon]|nr:phosphoribosyltransferase [Candidatus Jordarchaeia archaeon]MBS7269952.1 phosphoribosyltransferase [Candidatus Jordarchaeia archaeon]MBS7280648.1 phosphoribosyltransferase [Candidatus Jordarchaeia archaeon]
MFRDRIDAGEKLAKELLKYKGSNIVVLAIPRGGVVVGFEVAKELGAPLDIVVPRKIPSPIDPELGIGAVTQDGTIIIDPEIKRYVTFSEEYVREEAERQIKEIERRTKTYRGDLQPIPVKNKIVIIVDDGLATGATMRAAIRSIRKQKPKKIVVAVPVGPPSAVKKVEEEADEVISLITQEPFEAVGQFYYDFSQTSDSEVITLLQKAQKGFQ